ncbi:glucose-6-phosphate phosphate translocator 1 [Moniliophthora roreri]|nr:glucose-6-phosphate phosphate translocator 1 [Moniliophthora roreri]
MHLLLRYCRLLGKHGLSIIPKFSIEAVNYPDDTNQAGLGLGLQRGLPGTMSSHISVAYATQLEDDSTIPLKHISIRKPGTSNKACISGSSDT